MYPYQAFIQQLTALALSHEYSLSHDLSALITLICIGKLRTNLNGHHSHREILPGLATEFGSTPGKVDMVVPNVSKLDRYHSQLENSNMQVESTLP